MHRRRRAASVGFLALAVFLTAPPAAPATPPAAAQAQLPQNVYLYPMGSFAQNAMMSSLAGIVNRTTHGEVLLSADNPAQPNPRFWLDQLKLSNPQTRSQVQDQPSWYLNHYKDKLSGYVLYDQSVNNQSINLASTIAGATGAIIVDPSTRLTAILSGLPQVADARNMTYASVYARYGNALNKDMLFHLDPGKDHLLRDYAILNKGFVCYTNPTALNPYAANQNHQGRIFGWGPSEVDLFTQASQNNQQVVPSDFSWSSSTTSQWKVPIARQKYHPPGNILTHGGRHYVAFVMSDGDNVQWLTNAFATDPRWFGSPHRGNFNMTWDFSPSLADMNPIAHNYLYNHAADGASKDSFIAAGGAGTIFPSQYPDIEALAASIGQSMAAGDLNVTSILDTSYNPVKLFPILDQPQVAGMMFKTYDNFYKGRNGAITWHKGKPIVSVKYSLWDGADTVRSIADALNASAHTDPIDDAASYSIVNVHPWSVSGPDGTGTGDPMSNLEQLVQWLDPNKVQVVGLEELMVQLRNHFGLPLPGAVINATWTRDASSDWGTTRTNWTGAMPNFIDATVNFGSAIGAARTVTVSAAMTAGTINFDSGVGYTLAGTHPITLDTSPGRAAAINVMRGCHAISAPLALAADTTITIAQPGSTLTVSNLQSSSARLTKAGPGMLIVNSVRTGRLSIEAGTVVVTSNGPAARVEHAGDHRRGRCLDRSFGSGQLRSWTALQQRIPSG
jgi:hypothetical protein